MKRTRKVVTWTTTTIYQTRRINGKLTLLEGSTTSRFFMISQRSKVYELLSTTEYSVVDTETVLYPMFTYPVWEWVFVKEQLYEESQLLIMRPCPSWLSFQSIPQPA